MLRDEGPLDADGRLHGRLRRAELRHAAATRGSSNLWRLDELRGIERARRRAVDRRAGDLHRDLIRSPLVQQRAADARRRPRARSAACRSRIAARSAATSRTPRRPATRCRCWRPPTRASCCASADGDAARAVHAFYTGYRQTVRAAGRADRRASRFRAFAGRQWFRKVGTRAAQAISKVVMAARATAATSAAHRARQRRADGRAAARTEAALAAGASIADAQRILLRRDRADRRHALDGRVPPARGGEPAREFWRESGQVDADRSRAARRAAGRANGRHPSTSTAAASSRSAARTTRRRRGDRRCGESRGLAGHRRHARPRQRAGPHRMGRLRDGDARGRAPAASRRSSTCRSTAIPATTTVAALDAKRHAARGLMPRRRRRSGAASCRATRATLEPLVDAGVRGFKCFLVPSGVDEFAHVGEGRSRAGDAGARAARCPAAGARGAARVSSAPHRGRPRELSRRIAATRPVDAERRRDRPDGDARARVQAPASTSCTVVGGGASEAVAAARADGVPITARDLSALPDVRRRRDSRRRDRVQVRAADSERGAIARRCGGAANRARSISSRPITRRRRRR